MSGLIKYRVHEVAKDFGMTSKEITQIPVSYTHLTLPTIA